MYRIEKIILLFDDSNLTQRLTRDFALWGIPLRVLQERTAAELSLEESAEPGELMLMCSQKQELLRDVGCLRAQSPTIGIVVLLMDEIVSPVHSGFLMLAGADICLGQRAQSMEVLASIQALRRRELALKAKYLEAKEKNAVLPASIEMKASEIRLKPGYSHGWNLVEDGWRLLTPEHHAVALTGAERRVLRVLLEQSPEPVTREKLFSDKEGDQPTSRYIDVVVSRLKRKVAQYGERLPVRSVWGVGYVFSAE